MNTGALYTPGGHGSSISVPPRGSEPAGEVTRKEIWAQLEGELHPQSCQKQKGCSGGRKFPVPGGVGADAGELLGNDVYGLPIPEVSEVVRELPG